MEEKEMEISLQDLLQILWQNKWLIIGVSLFTTIVAAVISIYVLEPIYQAETTVLVTSRENQEQLTLNDLMLSERLVNTYSELIKSNRILDKVIEQLNLRVDAKKLRRQIAVTVVSNTEILRIHVKDKDPGMAQDIANAVVSVFTEQLPMIYTQSEKSVSTIDVAKRPKIPVEPNKKMNVVLGFMLGAFLSAGIVFLREMLRNTFRSPKDIESHLGIPVIGIISEEKGYGRGEE